MINHLSSITPFLEDTAEKIPLEVMQARMQAFETAYDQMIIKGKMVDDAVEHNLSEKGTVSNVTIWIIN